MTPLPLMLYRAATATLWPVFARRVDRRLLRANVTAARRAERRGIASLPRPDGPLIWAHGASVGEVLSLLPLVQALLDSRPGLHVLLTSGTATAALAVAGRLPARALHQFSPLDAGPLVARFLDHWRPDGAILVESEVWPNSLLHLDARRIPRVLVNARMSPGSMGNWRRFAGTARALLGGFRLVHCQTDETAAFFAALCVDVTGGPNLKALAGPAPVDAAVLDAARVAIADRPVWVASSTHPGEDAPVIAAHQMLRAAVPDALLILVPRHPERAPEIAALIAAAGLHHAQRSAKGVPGARDAVWLADTIGETALWYALAGTVFLGGSWVPVGGHNPFEPARAGAGVLHGALHHNFDAVYQALDAAGGGQVVADASALAAALRRHLTDPDQARQMQQAAQRFAATQSGDIAELRDKILLALAL